MLSMNYYSNQSLLNDVGKIMSKVDNFDKDILKNFVTYWLIRKADPFSSDNIIKEMTSSGDWIDIIESNNKFRVMYGEEIASRIIKIIEEEMAAKK